MFHCPIDGCAKAFSQTVALEEHMTLGKHRKIPDRLTLRDLALQTYKAALEKTAIIPQIPELQEALQSLEV